MAPERTGISPQLAAAINRFGAAYAEWLAARADLVASHDDGSEDAEQKRHDRERAAEVALIATAAPHSTAIWDKWELVERLLTYEQESGPGKYPVTLLGLAALKCDILALGLKLWPDERLVGVSRI
jgi:hypothetical protein